MWTGSATPFCGQAGEGKPECVKGIEPAASAKADRSGKGIEPAASAKADCNVKGSEPAASAEAACSGKGSEPAASSKAERIRKGSEAGGIGRSGLQGKERKPAAAAVFSASETEETG